MRRLSARHSDRVSASARRSGERRSPARRARTNARSARAARRPQPLRQRLARLPWRLLALAASVLTAGAVATYLWHANGALRPTAMANAALHAIGLGAGLAIGEVYVEGRGETPPEALRAALGVAVGDPILSFDADAAKARIEGLGWVASATVERRFPDIVHVRLVERRPAAIWQHDGSLAVVDAEGVVLAEGDVARYADLPHVVGDGAAAHFPALLRALATAPALAGRITSAVWVGGRRWNLRIDDRVDVRLPEQGLESAWGRLAAMQASDRILDRDITVLDLRPADRAVVRLPAGANT